jgi:hypothetical protein
MTKSGIVRYYPQISHRSHRSLPSDTTSVDKGVSFNKRSGKWVAGITVYGVSFQLGSFDTAEEANNVYCMACEKYHVSSGV